ncbi:hypothetical protein [Desmospora activa]|uniref:Uncharacterized protein n=1 Tax=Desmospora activa DSM 45169 TaxID=1121389 RepID=A0A2T4Z3K3_9BACL|nr:hypothetical protein [Desmospora activa]PTM56462.1 hypothetical protein C8J48_2784 [Desmospora activa DSM 45169]
MAKGKVKKESKKRVVDPVQVLIVDLKRTGLWVAIAVGVTFLGAIVVETLM